MERCFGSCPGQELYAKYHDEEWGVPSYDDRHLFEMLVLEGCQAGLSWELILKKREGYKKAFYHFDPKKVAAMKDEELEALRQNPNIIRNRLKIYAARRNAQVFLQIQKEFGSFHQYLWAFVDYKPILNHPKNIKEILCFSELSTLISKELKKRGMTFVGPKIIYSYLQAVGVINDHLVSCFCKNLNGSFF